MNLRLLKLGRFHQKPRHLITMSRLKIKMVRKIKGNTLLKRKIKGLER